MKCELCSTDSETVLVALITGKRGRPPHKHYCASCIATESAAGRCKDASPEARQTETMREAARVRKPRGNKETIIVRGVFDPAAQFLLNMRWDNLFEAAHALDDDVFRCKGCRVVLKRAERESHFRWHRGEDYTPVKTEEYDDELANVA